MVSRVITSNFRLAYTDKIWPKITKKIYHFKVIKLNGFITSFLYHYLLQMNAQVLFTYYYYKTSLFWFFDLFVFRGLRGAKKEVTARFATIWMREKEVFFKFRRPFNLFSTKFNIITLNGFIYYWAGKQQKFQRILRRYVRRRRKKLRSFLIWYKRLKSKNINLLFKGVVTNRRMNKNKLFQLVFKRAKAVFLKSSIINRQSISFTKIYGIRRASRKIPFARVLFKKAFKTTFARQRILVRVKANDRKVLESKFWKSTGGIKTNFSSFLKMIRRRELKIIDRGAYRAKKHIVQLKKKVYRDVFKKLALNKLIKRIIIQNFFKKSFLTKYQVLHKSLPFYKASCLSIKYLKSQLLSSKILHNKMAIRSFLVINMIARKTLRRALAGARLRLFRQKRISVEMNHKYGYFYRGKPLTIRKFISNYKKIRRRQKKIWLKWVKLHSKAFSYNNRDRFGARYRYKFFSRVSSIYRIVDWEKDQLLLKKKRELVANKTYGKSHLNLIFQKKNKASYLAFIKKKASSPCTTAYTKSLSIIDNKLSYRSLFNLNADFVYTFFNRHANFQQSGFFEENSIKKNVFLSGLLFKLFKAKLSSFYKFYLGFNNFVGYKKELSSYKNAMKILFRWQGYLQGNSLDLVKYLKQREDTLFYKQSEGLYPFFYYPDSFQDKIVVANMIRKTFTKHHRDSGVFVIDQFGRKRLVNKKFQSFVTVHGSSRIKKQFQLLYLRNIFVRVFIERERISDAKVDVKHRDALLKSIKAYAMVVRHFREEAARVFNEKDSSKKNGRHYPHKFNKQYFYKKFVQLPATLSNNESNVQFKKQSHEFNKELSTAYLNNNVKNKVIKRETTQLIADNDYGTKVDKQKDLILSVFQQNKFTRNFNNKKIYNKFSKEHIKIGNSMKELKHVQNNSIPVFSYNGKKLIRIKISDNSKKSTATRLFLFKGVESSKKKTSIPIKVRSSIQNLMKDHYRKLRLFRFSIKPLPKMKKKFIWKSKYTANINKKWKMKNLVRVFFNTRRRAFRSFKITPTSAKVNLLKYPEYKQYAHDKRIFGVATGGDPEDIERIHAPKKKRVVLCLHAYKRTMYKMSRWWNKRVWKKRYLGGLLYNTKVGFLEKKIAGYVDSPLILTQFNKAALRRFERVRYLIASTKRVLKLVNRFSKKHFNFKKSTLIKKKYKFFNKRKKKLIQKARVGLVSKRLKLRILSKKKKIKYTYVKGKHKFVLLKKLNVVLPKKKKFNKTSIVLLKKNRALLGGNRLFLKKKKIVTIDELFLPLRRLVTNLSNNFRYNYLAIKKGMQLDGGSGSVLMKKTLARIPNLLIKNKLLLSSKVRLTAKFKKSLFANNLSYQKNIISLQKILLDWAQITKLQQKSFRQKLELKRKVLMHHRKWLTPLQRIAFEFRLISQSHHTLIDKLRLKAQVIDFSKCSKKQKLLLKFKLLANKKFTLVRGKILCSNKLSAQQVVGQRIMPQNCFTKRRSSPFFLLSQVSKVKSNKKIVVGNASLKSFINKVRAWELILFKQKVFPNHVSKVQFIKKTIPYNKRSIMFLGMDQKLGVTVLKKKKLLSNFKTLSDRILKKKIIKSRLKVKIAKNLIKNQIINNNFTGSGKSVIKLEVPTDIYTLPVGTEQKKWLRKYKLTSLIAKKKTQHSGTCAIKLVKKHKAFFQPSSLISRKLLPNKENIKVSKKKTQLTFISVEDKKLFKFLKYYLGKRRLYSPNSRAYNKFFIPLLHYWLFARWQRHFSSSHTLTNYLNGKHQRFLIRKVIRGKKLLFNKKINHFINFDYLQFKVAQQRKSIIEKIENLFVNEPYMRKPERITFYHWIRGWGRFRRIRHKISNIGKYYEFMNRNFSKGRRLLCIQYHKTFWDKAPEPIIEKTTKLPQRELRNLLLTHLFKSYLKFKLTQPVNFSIIDKHNKNILLKSFLSTGERDIDAVYPSFIKQKHEKSLTALVETTPIAQQLSYFGTTGIVYNRLKNLKRWVKLFNFHLFSKLNKLQNILQKKSFNNNNKSRLNLFNVKRYQSLNKKRVVSKFGKKNSHYRAFLTNLFSIIAESEEQKIYDKRFLNLAEVSRLIVFNKKIKTIKNILFGLGIVNMELDLVNDYREFLEKKRRFYLLKKSPSYLPLLKYLWYIFLKRKKILRKFLIRKKKKFFLLKYHNLIYSLRFSVYLQTNIRCFFISCLSLLFFKHIGRKKFRKIYKILNYRVVAYGKTRKLKGIFLKRFNFIFFLSFKFKQFHLFLDYIKFLFIKFSRRQFVAVGFFKNFLKKGFLDFAKNLIGLQFSLKGKMNRRPRARRILMLKKSKPPFQDLQLKVLYYAKEVITYFGMFMFRLWIYYY